MLCACYSHAHFPRIRHNRRFANSKELLCWIFHAHANGYLAARLPVERFRCTSGRPLSISDDIGIRSDSKADAVHMPRESKSGLGQDVNFGRIPRI